jgi:hypothetical protein
LGFGVRGSGFGVRTGVLAQRTQRGHEEHEELMVIVRTAEEVVKMQKDGMAVYLQL